MSTKVCNKCGEKKDKSCFSKDKAKKDGLRNWCKACCKSYHDTNKKRIHINQKVYYRAHKKEHNARTKAYYTINRESRRTCTKAYYHAHKEEFKVLSRAWRQKNRGRSNANTRRYQAAKLNRTPGWLTPEQEHRIKDFYVNCPEGMVVDHIIPLQGEYISGFHHPDNLQYLTHYENNSKHNTYPVEGRI